MNKFDWRTMIPVALLTAGVVTAFVRNMFPSKPHLPEQEVGRWESEGGQAAVSETNPVPQAKQSRVKLAAAR